MAGHNPDTEAAPPTSFYEIWRYIPRDIVEETAREFSDLEPGEKLDPADYGMRYCPLGYALHRFQEEYAPNVEIIDGPTPSCYDVKSDLNTLAGGTHTYGDQLSGLAAAFINAFDAGQIDDIEAALGVA